MLEDLPLAVLDIVCHQLDSQSLQNLSSTCRSLRAIAFSHTRALKYSVTDNTPIVAPRDASAFGSAIVRSRQGTRGALQVTVDGVRAFNFAPAVIDTSYSHHEVVPWAADALILKGLHISPAFFSSALNPERLVRLDLDKCAVFSGMLDQLHKLSSLQHLTISQPLYQGGGGIMDRGRLSPDWPWLANLSQLKQLATLELVAGEQGDRWVRESVRPGALSGLTSLQRLTVKAGWGSGVQPDVITAAIPHLTAITCLRLPVDVPPNATWPLEQHHLRPLATSCTGLVELGLRSVEEDGLKVLLSTCRHLTRLTLDDVPALETRHFMSLRANNCPLRILHCKHWNIASAEVGIAGLPLQALAQPLAITQWGYVEGLGHHHLPNIQAQATALAMHWEAWGTGQVLTLEWGAYILEDDAVGAPGAGEAAPSLALLSRLLHVLSPLAPFTRAFVLAAWPSSFQGVETAFFSTMGSSTLAQSVPCVVLHTGLVQPLDWQLEQLCDPSIFPAMRRLSLDMHGTENQQTVSEELARMCCIRTLLEHLWLCSCTPDLLEAVRGGVQAAGLGERVHVHQGGETWADVEDMMTAV